MVIKEIRCKSILNKSGIPTIDYGVNPYIGCEHKCQYCYAVFMKRFAKQNLPWGDFVHIKMNAPEVFGRQLKTIKRGDISFGTVCDAYQQAEVKYKITRKCLEKLTHSRHNVSILTKSDLVLRDLDILKKIPNIEVGFTISTLDPRVKKIFEPQAPSPQKRLRAIKILSYNGIYTWVFAAPLLPYLSDSKEAISKLFIAAQDAGARYIMFDTLNPYPKVWNNVKCLTNKYFPEAIECLDHFYHNKFIYKKRLEEKISKIGRRYSIKFKLAFSRVC